MLALTNLGVGEGGTYRLPFTVWAMLLKSPTRFVSLGHDPGMNQEVLQESVTVCQTNLAY